MSNHNDMPLTMNSDTFAAFRNDFDKLLARTICNMEMKGTVEATITCKFCISLEKQQTRDFRSNGYDGCRDIINPTIKHDITSVMQVKDKVSGKFHGDYEMVFDRDTNRYLIRKVQDGQLDVFDDDGNEIGALGLPAPDDFVDADEDREDDGEENNAADAAPMNPFKLLREIIKAASVAAGEETCDDGSYEYEEPESTEE